MDDFYRILYPDFKFILGRKNPLRLARLGYILFSESFSNVVNNISVKPGYWSDHSAVIMEIDLIILLKGMVSES